jgi:hypothetical protein
MPLHDHPYSDVNIIYRVVQTGDPEVRLWKYYRNPDRNAWISFLPHLSRVLLIERRILPGIMVVDY